MPPMDFCRFSPHWGMQSIPNFSGDLLHLTYWGSFKYSSPVHWVCKPSFNLLSLMNIRVWSIYAEFPPAYICVCHRFQAVSSPFSQHFTGTLSGVAISCISRDSSEVCAGLISTSAVVKAASHGSGAFGQASLCPSRGIMGSLSSIRALGHWLCPGQCQPWADGRESPAVLVLVFPTAQAELLCGIKNIAQCWAIFPVLLTKICAGFILWGRMYRNINTYAWKHILWEPASREQSSEWLWIKRLIWHLSMHS